MKNWFFRKNGIQTGPYSLEQIKQKAQKNPFAEAKQEGGIDWTYVADIAELGLAVEPTQAAITPPPPISTTPTPAPPLSRNNHVTEGIDYQIFGTEMQFVEIELDPQESVIAEAGSMMYKDPRIEMETIFGDGTENKDTGFLGLLAGAGRRLVTGESMFTTVFTHNGRGKAVVSFAAPYAGNIIPFRLQEMNGTIICQKDAFLCASKGIGIGIHFSKKIMTGLFGGEGFILQKLSSEPNDPYALAFVHAGGTIVEKELAAGDVLEIDTGCLVAMTTNIDFDVRYVGGIKSALFGGEGLFFGTLTAKGTGRVWLQSLPFSRLAGRILSINNFGSRQGGEGSLLGGLGDIFNGDNR